MNFNEHGFDRLDETASRAMRYDDNKPDYTFISSEILKGMAGVMAFGAKKYARNNWLNSLNTEEHDAFQEGALRSLLRHAHALADGELRDPETGEYHVNHIACNAMFWLVYQLRKKT